MFNNVYDKESLAEFLNISVSALLFLCHGKKNKLYREFTIPKKSGGTRTICAPKGNLVNVQRRLAEELRHYYKKPVVVMGFEPNTSIVKNAEKHVGKKFLINIDLKDFFNQITIKRVIGMLRKVTKLSNEVCVMLAQLLTADGILPTGSPASPLISNMVFFGVDNIVISYLKNSNICYTRYADDLTFSFNDESLLHLFFDDDDCTVLCKKFQLIFDGNDFPLNLKKVRIQKNSEHQRVTGIKVNKKLNLTKKYINFIRMQLHLCEKYGMDSVAKHYFESKGIGYSDSLLIKYKNVLAGKISFLKMVKFSKKEKQYKNFASAYNLIVKKRSLKIHSTDIKEIKNNSILLCEDYEGGAGTAFFYRGKIITCSHVLEVLERRKNGFQKDYEFCLGSSKTIVRAKLVAQSSEHEYDYAIFEPTNAFDYYDLERSNINLNDNEEIKIVGFPDYSNNAHQKVSVTPGDITTSRDNTDGKGTIYVTNIPVKPGNSGGPVLDKDNKVAGYMVYGAKDDKTCYFENGFLDISYIDKAIDEL